MTEADYKRDYPDYDHEKLHKLLMDCAGRLHIAALKETDGLACSATQHRSDVWRKIRDWVREVEGSQ